MHLRRREAFSIEQQQIAKFGFANPQGVA